MAAQLGSGGPKKKFELGQNSNINVTPFVDVMLVLLIIFMVTAPLATVSIKIDLPPAKPPTDVKSKPPTYISISKTGIFVSLSATQMKPSSLPTLGADVAQGLGVPNPTNERVFIRADKDVKYRQFMDVINQLQTDGYFKIGLISEEV